MSESMLREARDLQKHTSNLTVDAFSEAGGLASTDVTKEGFLFDVGGHVCLSCIHSRFVTALIKQPCRLSSPTTLISMIVSTKLSLKPV